MQESNRVVVVMVPFPAHSHLNQLLQLSCLITSSYSIPVHYVSSSIHIKQAKTRAHRLNPSDLAKIRFHELPLPDFESPPPDPDSIIKFPVHLQPLWIAAMSLREPFADYLGQTHRKFEKVVIIHDIGMSWVVQDVISLDNAESYGFNPISAFSMASFVLNQLGQPIQVESSSKDLPSFEDCFPDKGVLTPVHMEPRKYRSGDLYNTVRSLEASFLNSLAKEEISEGRTIWAIGPILPTKLSDQSKSHKCLDWLDKHELNSVIYVSFGTTVSISDEEIRELALGLEQSGAKFLWVLRDADRGNVFDGDMRRVELPQGFEERIEGVGYIVRDWAPQLDILAHPSTGGFMSHCGWNSCLESVTMGVPLAAWPMHADQPRNAYLVTEILKAGIVVREWSQRRELVKASVIADVVRRLMATEEGDVIRRRVQEMGMTLRQATEEGGESKVEMDSFIAHITRK